MTNNELKITATCIQALASQHDADQKIQMFLRSLFSSYKNQADFSVPDSGCSHAVSGFISFSKKELSTMDKTFKKEFIAQRFGRSRHQT